MPVRGHLVKDPPLRVSETIAKLGRDLRTARLRRNISLEEMAAKVGVNRHVIAAAEHGKLTTGIGVYAAMLWAMNLIHQIDPVADPLRDEEGMALSSLDERERAYPSRGLSNDF